MTFHNTERPLECDDHHLAELFGTPLLVMDEPVLRHRMRRFREAFQRPGWSTSVVYAAKALMLQAVARIAWEEGLLLDACSEGELHTALRAGVPGADCIMHGCAKTSQELALAVESGVRHVVVDNQQEIIALDAFARAAGKRSSVLVRVNPGIAAATKAQIQTGSVGSKFGFPIGDGQALAAVRAVCEAGGLLFGGVHCHLGSQIFDLSSYAHEIQSLAVFAADIQAALAIAPRIINLGGGLGVGEADEADGLLQRWADTVFETATQAFAAAALPRPELMIEPGRAIVAHAGSTLYRVVVGKTLADGRRALIVDGGMSDNPRPALYEASYRVSRASRSAAAKSADGQNVEYTIFGRHCETDLLFPSVRLPETKVGDLLRVHDTGAYTYSMASNYNRFARPAVVLVEGTRARLIARREPLEHLLDLDTPVQASASHDVAVERA
ncbi:MAG: diaminopimelate decarboxylase [Candidatus Eremiobacteraeota bacterium]|nr:diaminopimelate decarboxylase [Candidatus Eremiobacteraeota bacterium]